MTVADQVQIYVEVLARWGPVVAMQGCGALLARDSLSKWWTENN